MEDKLSTLLHSKKCPVGYRCLATDCIECLEIYTERGEHHGKGQNAGLQQTLHTGQQS